MEEKSIILDVDSGDFVYSFPIHKPLELYKNPQIAMERLFFWYTYPNISPKYENNRLLIKIDDAIEDLTLDTGMYEVDDINLALQKAFNTNSVKFAIGVNKVTFKCYVKTVDGVAVDFSQGNLYKLLGLSKKIYDQPYEEGPNLINITRNVDRLFIRCDLVENEQFGYENVLYDIIPYAPGSAIQKEPERLRWLKCKSNFIREIRLKVTDRNNKIVHISEPYSLTIAFRSLK